MPRDRSEVGELAARIFDRLESQFEGAEVIDAVLLVEIDTGERLELDDGTGREAAPTVVMLESTDDRLTVQVGIIHFAKRTLLDAGEADAED